MCFMPSDIFGETATLMPQRNAMLLSLLSLHGSFFNCPLNNCQHVIRKKFVWECSFQLINPPKCSFNRI